ncbi:MAG: hypothetical protein FJ396_01890 [Verrucomicrobia bacterium]|nr:hypothetical protein [Verrucomicrobiota bacterium]
MPVKTSFHSLSRAILTGLLLLATCVDSTLLGAKSTQPPRAKAFPEPDSDGDGLSDVLELRFDSDPFAADTDGDGANDLAEYLAGTRPRDKTSIPLFQPADRDRQLLGGDLLRLRPLSIKPLSLKTNETIVTNEPPAAGGDPTYTTNREVITNYTTYQWFRDGRALPGQTNLHLVLFGAERPDSGRYLLEARLEDSIQREPKGIRIDVLGTRAVREFPRPSGELVTWGREVGSSPPRLTNAVGVARGFVHAYAVDAGGKLSGWGTNTLGQLGTPANLPPVRDVAAGAFHTVALLTNGTVRAWGDNRFGQTSVPEGLASVVAVAAGQFHTMALRQDGTVVCWGDNGRLQCLVPPGVSGAVAIAAGAAHSVALMADGSVVCWGSDERGQATEPAKAPRIARIAAGDHHTLALTREGRVIAWGDTAQKQVPAPPRLPPLIAIAGGATFSVGLDANGTGTGWGTTGLAPMAALQTNLLAVAAGFQAAAGIRGRADGDQDGVDDPTERALGLSTVSPDSDQDGLEDGIELRLGLDPLLPDSDGDGLADLSEISQSTDSDGDGIPDTEELRRGLNPLARDTDSDGAPDGDEVAAGTDPASAGSYPVFELLDRDRQLLAGDRLVLRVVSLVPATPALPPAPVAPPPPPTPVDPEADPGADPGGTGETGGTSTNAPPTPPAPAIKQPTFQWFRNDRAIAGHTNASLVLHDTLPEESGTYRLEAYLDLTNRVQTSRGLRVEVLELRRAVLPERSVGRLVAWGDDTFGQASPPAGAGPVDAVAAGFGHSLALRTNGTVVAWGLDSRGQARVPAGLTDVVAIAAGGGHSVALTRDGRVVAWGDNDRGQTAVPSLLTNAVAIAAGDLHTLALDAAGRIWAWGDSTAGQTNAQVRGATRLFAGATASGWLDGSGRFRTAGSPGATNLAGIVGFTARDGQGLLLGRNGAVFPVPGTAGTPPGAASPALGIALTRSVGAAVAPDGSITAWGDTNAPAWRVPAGLRQVTRLAGGSGHFLAVQTDPDADTDGVSDAMERATGSNPAAPDSDGDGLEDGLEPRLGSSPVLADTDGDGLDDRLEWLHGLDALVGTERPDGWMGIRPLVSLRTFALGGDGYRLQGSWDGLTWTSLEEPRREAPGWTQRFLAPLPLWPLYRLAGPDRGDAPGESPVEGTVVAWGDGRLGQTSVPRGLGTLRQISAGTWHTLALRADGTVVAWGDSTDGKLSVPPTLRDVVAVAAGGNHSLALDASGRITGWGREASGQTVAPALRAPATAIAAGGDYGLALLADGTVVAWGANYSGQLEVPPGLRDVVAIAAGWSHAVALRKDGTVACWGNNRAGQCEPPPGLVGVVAVAAGDAHTVALRADGSVVVWGADGDGQRRVPAGLDRVVRVQAGYNHTVALRDTGELVSWGGESGDVLRVPASATAALQVSAGGFHTVALLQARDTDGDGLDDRLEAVLGTSPEAADTDGDGLSDAREWRFGSDPKVPGEAADGTVRVLPAVQLDVFTLGSRTYRLQVSTNLLDVSDLGPPIRGVTGFSSQQVEILDSNQFFRLIHP